jgi:hypothetical protein
MTTRFQSCSVTKHRREIMIALYLIFVVSQGVTTQPVLVGTFVNMARCEEAMAASKLRVEGGHSLATALVCVPNGKTE